jgi:hypothetical protein
MRKFPFLILSALLAFPFAKAAVPGLEFSTDSFIFWIDAPFETYSRENKVSDGYLKLVEFFKEDGSTDEGCHCLLLNIKRGWPTWSIDSHDVKGNYSRSAAKVSVFVNVNDEQAILILYDEKPDKIENASLINKVDGESLKMVFREKSDVLLTDPQGKSGQH